MRSMNSQSTMQPSARHQSMACRADGVLRIASISCTRQPAFRAYLYTPFANRWHSRHCSLK